MGTMFLRADSLTSIDVSNWDVSNVRYMYKMFGDARSLTNLDVSNWDTRNVRRMDGMFGVWEEQGVINLTTLDLSNWDTTNLTNMNEMFNNMLSLNELTLGENFIFRDNSDLPPVRQTNDFTGYWQNIGSGTVANPTGRHVLTSEQLMSQFNGYTMADTFVWQPVSTRAILLRLIANAEYRLGNLLD
ncbi:MAG: BspA family leucine-rich repeat surface protein [Defluviitaleaceae bacterium]|nr:BspA family leucine-rich repeat surface protein [Defluviitaleaceae bacterium]